MGKLNWIVLAVVVVAIAGFVFISPQVEDGTEAMVERVFLKYGYPVESFWADFNSFYSEGDSQKLASIQGELGLLQLSMEETEAAKVVAFKNAVEIEQGQNSVVAELEAVEDLTVYDACVGFEEIDKQGEKAIELVKDAEKLAKASFEGVVFENLLEESMGLLDFVDGVEESCYIFIALEEVEDI